jgi:methyltransferase-like protein/SAM-dependent methyltransferase
MRELPVSDYDTIAYPSAVFPQTHPERLATIATLFGLQPAPVHRARVLELGCGDGNNLIAMACTLPESEFHGVDLAIEPIRRGREALAALGLKNVSLRQLNILEMPPNIGRFDYIIAHGLYSWVPDAVREKILLICGEHLAENGVAYISYNAYPGCHLRDSSREMMLFHVRQIPDPAEQIRQARALLKFLAGAKSQPGIWQGLLRFEFERLEKLDDAGFFHDDLSSVNQPFYFHQFIQAAERHQLEYLAEANVADMQPAGLTEEGIRTLYKMENGNRVAHEQYMDFVVGRGFRQTLLCRRGRRLDRELKPERVCNLFAAADVSPVNPEANLTAPVMEDFQRDKTVIATSQPALKSALVILGALWPRRVPFNQLLSLARERAGRDETTLDSDRRDLADFLVRCYAIGIASLHAHASTFVIEISERPIASPLARLQISQSDTVSTLRHQPVKIEDALLREVLRLLDGTRDRDALLEELAKTVQASEDLARDLETCLKSLAELGLLVG